MFHEGIVTKDLSQYVCPYIKCTLRGPFCCNRCDWNEKQEEKK